MERTVDSKKERVPHVAHLQTHEHFVMPQNSLNLYSSQISFATNCQLREDVFLTEFSSHSPHAHRRNTVSLGSSPTSLALVSSLEETGLHLEDQEGL